MSDSARNSRCNGKGVAKTGAILRCCAWQAMAKMLATTTFSSKSPPQVVCAAHDQNGVGFVTDHVEGKPPQKPTAGVAPDSRVDHFDAKLVFQKHGPGVLPFDFRAFGKAVSVAYDFFHGILV